MLLRNLSIGLGLDLRSLDSDISAAGDRLAAFGRSAAVDGAAAIPAPHGAGAPGDAGGKADPAAGVADLGARLGASLAAAMAPMARFSQTMTRQLDAIGGTVVTLARRIDSSMKFPASEAALAKLRQKFEGTWVGAAAGAGQVALKLKGFFENFGDVAGKSLAKLKGIDAATFSTPAAGAARLSTGFAAVDRPVQQVTASVKGLGREIALALGAFSLVSKAVEFFKSGITGASDLNETLSKTQAIFGDSAKVITDESARMAQSFGVAKNEFMTAAGNFGAVFKGVGKSREEAAGLGNTLAKLGMDLASFDNSTNAEAFTAISAALRGEFDPIERFRVFLNADAIAAEALSSGLAKSKKEIDESAKKQATLNLILRQSVDAQGDLERTAGGAANQFRKAGGGLSNFATTVGELLLPAVQSAVVGFNELLATAVEVFETNRAMIQGWADAVKGAVDFVGVVVRNLGTMFEIVKLRAGEMAMNTAAAFATLPENLAVLADYIGRNWQTLLGDLVIGAGAVFENLLTNAKNFGLAFWEALKGNGFDFTFTPLLEGFRAEAEKLPDLVKPAWVSVQAEIDALGAEMAAKEAKRAEGIAKASPAKKVADKLDAKDKDDKLKLAGAAEVGSKEAYKTLAFFRAGEGRGGDDGIKTVARTGREQLKVSMDMLAELKKRQATGTPSLSPSAFPA